MSGSPRRKVIKQTRYLGKRMIKAVSEATCDPPVMQSISREIADAQQQLMTEGKPFGLLETAARHLGLDRPRLVASTTYTEEPRSSRFRAAHPIRRILEKKP